MLLFSLSSWIGFYAWIVSLPGGFSPGVYIDGAAPWVVASVYLPALLLVFVNRAREGARGPVQPDPPLPVSGSYPAAGTEVRGRSA
jgi:hypothetical protein